MAIEFFTGFEGCANTGDVLALIDAHKEIKIYTTDGYENGKSVGPNTTLYDDWYIGKNTIPDRTKAIGCHMRNASVSTHIDKYLFYFIGPEIKIYNTSSGLRIIGSSLSYTVPGGELLSYALSHIEAEIYSHPTAGTVKIKLNGGLVCDLSGVNTGDANITQVRWGSTGEDMYPGPAPLHDNIYIADVLQGELYSYLLKPSSDESVQFTPSAGTDNFEMLQSDDGDTSYVQSDIVGHKDLYGYEDLPVNLIPLSITTVTNARKEGTGIRQLQSISKQDATEYDDSDVITLSTTYPNSTTNRAITKVRSLAPDGTAWTREKINAMQWGFKVAG